MSHPSAVQLLEAVQLFLAEAAPALDGRLAFHAKVAGNVLAILAREWEAAPDAAAEAALGPFGGTDALCAALGDGRLSPEDPAVLAAVRAEVLARLAVDNPRYATFARLQARAVHPDG